MRTFVVGLSLLLLAGCTSAVPEGQDEPPDAGPSDAGSPDAGPAPVEALAPRIISIESTNQAESDPWIEVSGSAVAATWLALDHGGALTVVASFSEDFGRTWSAPQRLSSGPQHDASDPALVADGRGGFFLTWTPMDEFGIADSVRIAHAPAGSRQFGAPVEITKGARYDQPKGFVTSQGTLLVAFNQRADDQGTTPNQIALARSSDDGRTWVHSSLATGQGYRNQVKFCGTTSSGRIVALHLGRAEGLVLSHSQDDGRTWVLGATVVPAPARNIEFLPSCVARDETVWVAYSMGAPGTSFAEWSSSSILVTRSTDQGVTVGTAFEALDPAGPPLAKHATLVLEPRTNRVALFYYGAQASPDPLGSLRWTLLDASATKAPASRFVVTSGYAAAREWPSFMGDYMKAIALPDGSLLAAYVDNTTNAAHVGVVGVVPDPLP